MPSSCLGICVCSRNIKRRESMHHSWFKPSSSHRHGRAFSLWRSLTIRFPLRLMFRLRTKMGIRVRSIHIVHPEQIPVQIANPNLQGAATSSACKGGDKHARYARRARAPLAQGPGLCGMHSATKGRTLSASQPPHPIPMQSNMHMEPHRVIGRSRIIKMRVE